MSQPAVERVMGKLVTDEGFRAEFFVHPERAVLRIGAELTREELSALLRISPTALADLCARVDDRICRLHVRAGSALKEGEQ